MDSSTTSTRFILTIVLPLVAAIAAVAVAAHRATQAPEFVQAARVVEAMRADGDLVIVYPEDRFPDLELLDPSIDAIAASSLPAELNRFERVFLIRARDEHPPAIRRMLAARSTLLHADDVEGLTVELFQLDAPDRVVLDLMDSIRTARVTVQARGEDPVECPWSADRFDCPDADWTWVGATTQVFAGEPQQCVWMHPVDGADVAIEFPVVSGTHVTGWYGLTDYAVSIPDGSPVRMALVAGSERERFRAHRQTGRRPLEFELPEDYSGPLRIVVSASRAGVRHFCWDLQVVQSVTP